MRSSSRCVDDLVVSRDIHAADDNDNDVIQESRDQTTPSGSLGADDVIVVTSPVYVPMAHEQSDADTELESSSGKGHQGHEPEGQGHASIDAVQPTTVSNAQSSKLFSTFFFLIYSNFTILT